ncbi:MAG: copper-binding protein [Deltaproteobacteria bacterium]|nr:copper-binding protein [Deltaproteobacteria bacterium]
MKRIFAFFMAIAFTLSFAALTVAAEKARAKVFTGTVEAVDAAAGTFSLKGKKETMELKAGEKVKLDGLKVGDKVTATYTEGVASKVVASKKAAPKPAPAAPAGK